MMKRKWYILCLVLLGCALYLRFAALSKQGEALRLRSNFRHLPAQTEEEKEQVRAASHACYDAARAFDLSAFAIAVFSAVPFYLSGRAKEAVPRAIFYILVAFFVLTQLILV